MASRAKCLKGEPLGWPVPAQDIPDSCRTALIDNKLLLEESQAVIKWGVGAEFTHRRSVLDDEAYRIHETSPINSN
jgi:hypothetical protein